MRRRRPSLLLLGLPTFGMALTITSVSSYLPVVLRGQAGSTATIGGILATEGLMALWVPIVAGDRSDHLRTRIGGRLPFVLAGTPLMFVSLCLVGLVGNLIGIAALVVVFFFGYFVAYAPYRAMYPDLVADEEAGRSQSVQAGWRGAGTGTALISGGLLLGVADFLPFVVYALLMALSVGLFVAIVAGGAGNGGHARRDGPDEGPGSFALVRRVLRENPALRVYFLCNGLWEMTLAAIKTFVVLYVTAGLGYSLADASLIIGAVAIVILLAALASGRIGDRYGRLRVVQASVLLFGLGLLVPALTTFRPALIVAVPIIAIGGGTLMSLPYSVLMPLMPEGEHGALTGLYALSRGVGVMAGPLCAGIAIDLLGPLFTSTEGYAATWLVAAAAALASLVPLRRLRAMEARRSGGS